MADDDTKIWAEALEKQTIRTRDAERERDRLVVYVVNALAVPAVWSEEERDGMAAAYADASKRHGHYESLFAVGAWLLRHRIERFLAEKAEGRRNG